VSFRPQPFARLREKFTRGASFTSSTAMSNHGLALLEKMLSLNPAARVTAEGALRHPYFAEDPPPKAHLTLP